MGNIADFFNLKKILMVPSIQAYTEQPVRKLTLEIARSFEKHVTGYRTSSFAEFNTFCSKRENDHVVG
jgi:hypothetical protein